jgi:hypothetical protein
MRLVTLLFVVIALVFGGIVVSSNVLRPDPAANRLAGVTVNVKGYRIEDGGEYGHKLRLFVNVNSLRDLDDCLAFALDEPFASRRVRPGSGTCIRPTTGRQETQLVFDRLTDDDIQFPEHTLVWGIDGGRCGIILTVFGVCVVDQAGTAAVKLPSKNPLPSFGPLFGGSFKPLFPLYTFSP